jgi:hypothetical protein
VIVWDTQYRVTTVSRKSRENVASRFPPESDHARHFSISQAASPAGESLRPYPRVCGLVDWMAP